MIRRAEKRDRKDFIDMFREFYSSEAVLHDVPEDYHEKAFDEMMRSNEYLEGLVFESEGNASGYALLSKTYSHEAGGLTVWVEELYVRPLYRNRGMGKEFFAYLNKSFPAKRYRLEIEPDNVAAKKLYEKVGYTLLGYVQMCKDELK